jgi:hypothetical protein
MSKIIAQLEPQVTESMDKRYRKTFESQAGYKGNGIYGIGRLHSTDTFELFLMFVADMENLDYDGKVEEIEEEVE